MNAKQEERLVAAWEALAARLGEWNEIARTAVSKHWPNPREPRPVEVTHLPTPEEKLKAQTGNSDGPVSEWLDEFDAEEELGPREKEWLAGQSTSTKATP